MGVIVIKCSLGDLASVVRSVEDPESPRGFEPVGYALGLLKRVECDVVPSLATPPASPATLPPDPNVTYLHFVAKLGEPTACGLPTDTIGHPTQTWATDKWDAVDCPACRQGSSVPYPAVAPSAPSPVVANVASPANPGRVLVKFAPTTDAKHVCQQVGLSLCGLKVSPNMVAPTVSETDCRECRQACERAFSAMPRAVEVETTWTVDRGAGPVEHSFLTDGSILLAGKFVEMGSPHHTALCAEWIARYPQQQQESYDRYRTRCVMQKIVAQAEASEKVKLAAAGKLPATAPVAPLAPATPALVAEPNPFAAAAADTDKLVEAQKRFDSLVGLWLQNFGSDSPAQPDRQGTLVGTFAGYGAGVVWKHIETQGGLGRAVLDSIVRNSWASQEVKEGVPSRVKLAKMVALNMVQVGSALGFPLHDYIEACVMHTMGEVKPDGSREPDDSALTGPMCRDGAKDTK